MRTAAVERFEKRAVAVIDHASALRKDARVAAAFDRFAHLRYEVNGDSPNAIGISGRSRSDSQRRREVKRNQVVDFVARATPGIIRMPSSGVPGSSVGLRFQQRAVDREIARRTRCARAACPSLRAARVLRIDGERAVEESYRYRLRENL